MNWQDIRARFAQSWVVVEAVGAYTDHDRRIIPDLQVMKAFGDDSAAAWAYYRQIHHENRDREYYVLHTDRAELDIGALDVFGRAIIE